MHAAGTFTVASFTPAELTPPPVDVGVGAPVGVATMEKVYDGEVRGRSATIFTSCFDQAVGVGTYVAMESFEGSLAGRQGSFAYVHAATTGGQDRHGEHFAVVPGSGTGDLRGIGGAGGMTIDADGTHRVWFDYTLADDEGAGR